MSRHDRMLAEFEEMIRNNAGEEALLNWGRKTVCELAYMEGLALGLASRTGNAEVAEMLLEHIR